MPKSHHSQSITKNGHELFSQSYLSLSLIGHVHILETQCSYIVTKTSESTVLYNYTILLNWENDRTSTQFIFLKLNPPSQSILASPPLCNPPSNSLLKTNKKIQSKNSKSSWR